MIKLEKNERVDWFRITVDLANHGIGTAALSKISGIPRSTIDCYRQKTHRPKLEEAIRLLTVWADMTGQNIDNVPIYNPFLPDEHPDQPGR